MYDLVSYDSKNKFTYLFNDNYNTQNIEKQMDKLKKNLIFCKLNETS